MSKANGVTGVAQDEDSRSLALKDMKHVVRHTDRDIRTPPKKPLTANQKKRLEEMFLPKFIRSYKSAMLQAGGFSDYEATNAKSVVADNLKLSDISKNTDQPILENDCDQDAYIYFRRVLERFDREGLNIGKKNYRGKDAPKTLEWFFDNYCRQEIGWAVKDTCKSKKAAKVGSTRNATRVYNYDAADGSSGGFPMASEVQEDFCVSEVESHRMEVALMALDEIRQNDPEFYRFATIKINLGAEQAEMEFGSRYRELNRRYLELRKSIQEAAAREEEASV